MIYIDFHTHQIPDTREIIPIYNQIIYPEPGREEPSPDWGGRSCGIHPWYIAADGVAQLARLETLARSSNILAIGEAGLDRLALADMPLQERLFEAQAHLADELGKPLVIHCVKAWDLLLSCRKRLSPRVPWVVHGFRGGVALARQLAGQGLGFSIGFHYNETVLRELPTDLFFLESDDHRADIRELYMKVAGGLSLPLSDLSERIRKNINSLFSLNY